MTDPLTLYHDSYSNTDTPIADVVLIHGWGMNSLIWDLMIPELLDHYRVTIVDLPGMGRSPISSAPYELKDIVARVLAVVPEKAYWVGWSLGGLVAMQSAASASSRVLGVLAMASTPKFVSDQDWPGIEADALRQFRSWVEEDWQGSLIRFLTLQAQGSATYKQEIRALRERLFHYGLPAQKALLGGLEILLTTDQRALLKEIACPIEFLVGGEDAVVPIDLASRLQTLWPSISVTQIADAAHIPMLSHPRQCADRVKALVSTVKSLTG